MKLSELKTKLCARVLYMPDPEREADGGYCGDFLSFVMQRAPENSVWFTVMTNVNVAAVEIGRASCGKACRSRWSPYH